MYSLEKFPAAIDAILARLDVMEKNLSKKEKLITGKEFDAMHGITKQTRINWQKKGVITPIKKGRRNYFKI